MNKKHLYLEVLRIFAIFFVIFNHTSTFGSILFTKFQTTDIRFWFDMFWSIFCKFAVPIFFAISGSLLLTKEESLKEIFKKRISKIIMVLIPISIIYYIHGSFFHNYDLNFTKFLEKLYTCDIRIHLWYLYAYLAFLLTIPFIRAIAKNLSKTNYIYMTIIAIIFVGLVPILEFYLSQNSVHIYKHLRPNWLISDIVIYPLLGYFMAHKITDDEIKKHLPFLWGLNLLTLAFTCIALYYYGISIGTFASEKIQIFHKNFAVLNCICLFLSAKYFIPRIKINGFIEKIILSLGNCTFGIYLIHILVKDWLFEYCHNIVQSNKCIIVSFLGTLVILIISYALTAIIKRIPYIKKIIGY